MFGFVTKAKHEAALASQAKSHAIAMASLQADLDYYRPLAQKHLNSLAALKQNKGKGK